MTIDGAGNTLLSAREFNITPTTQTFTDWVGSSDLNDFYRFSLSNSSSFNLALNGLVADADVQLLDSSGNTLASSAAGSTTAESISRTLDAGTYYIQVYPYGSANTNYNLSVSATINDYAGNTLNNARQITLNSTASTYSDWVGSSDTNDYYRFNLSTNSSVNLALNGLVADANVQLLDSIGNAITSSANIGTATESISRTLDAGTYYIRVYPYGSVNTNYNLSVSATINDYAGNTLNDARQITLNSTASTYSDWVGSTDANDYYRFNLISSSNFNLGLNGLVADADVQLLDSSGNALASSTAGSTTAEAISRTLNSGTYYIRVYPYGGVNTNYNLSVSATINDFAGNTLNNARQITLNETNSTYSDWVGSSDTDDFYRFNLNSNSSVNLTLNGLIENADVQLLNSSGNVLTSSTVSGAVAESINRSLDAGTYYIRVYPYNGANTNYNLSVSATINDYAGNNFNSARQINLDSVASTYSDWVGSADTNDFYRFNLSQTSSFNLTLNGLVADADVQLIWDSNSNGVIDSGEVIASSAAGGTTAEAISRTLNAGTYYIQVYPYGGANTNYNLSASITPNDYAGNTLNNARQIAVNSATSAYTDWVGSADTNDYYRFSLDTTRNLNLAINGLSGNADVQLLDSSGNALVSSTNGGTAAESISRTLGAGTYYIRVYPGNSGASTFYNLSIESTTAPVESNTLNSEWIRQLGTAGDDSSYSVAVDSAGNVYITGYTEGSLGGTNAGGLDGWLAKYTPNGTLSWKKQIGTSSNENSHNIGVDSSGNIYIVVEGGNPSGSSNPTNGVWLTRYDTNGNFTWTKELGINGYFVSFGLTVDNVGNVYVTGGTEGNSTDDIDILLTKYDSNGNLFWNKKLGTTSFDISDSITVDNAGNVYITGGTQGALGGNNLGSFDAWVAKYDTNGSLIWAKQLGTSARDYSFGVSVDNNGNVYITGGSEGGLGGNSAEIVDAWIAKYSSNGNLIWSRKLGSTGLDVSNDIAVDNAGYVYITGYTDAVLGKSNSGNIDAWIAKYDFNGNQLSIDQVGSSDDDISRDIAIDAAGNVYITGITRGALGSSNAGKVDAWIARY